MDAAYTAEWVTWRDALAKWAGVRSPENKAILEAAKQRWKEEWQGPTGDKIAAREPVACGAETKER